MTDGERDHEKGEEGLLLVTQPAGSRSPAGRGEGQY